MTSCGLNGGPLPDVGEYPKDMLLEFEKEVLGVYVSGHPLEEYEALWKKHITAKTTDFYVDNESGVPIVKDNETVTIGGLIADKKTKYTKNDQIMAFITLEDLVGSIEVIVFPKTYESNVGRLNDDAKVFIQGRVSAEEDKDAKLIASKIQLFDEVPRTLWIQFDNKESYEKNAKFLEETLLSTVAGPGARDQVSVYLKDTKQIKRLSPSLKVKADEATLNILNEKFGQENIRVV
jgi:DNA polymerase-3 subunit alpha